MLEWAGHSHYCFHLFNILQFRHLHYNSDLALICQQAICYDSVAQRQDAFHCKLIFFIQGHSLMLQLLQHLMESLTVLMNVLSILQYITT